MLSIHQGDQYNIEISLTDTSGTVVAPSDVDDIRITIGDYTKAYTTGEITYNSTKNVWCFPMTQEMSIKMADKTPCQIGILQDGNIIYTDVQMISVRKSINPKEWDDG